MYYVYLLLSEEGGKYIGYTCDLRRRVKEHQRGENRYTAQRGRGWKLIYYEAYPTKEMALKRERTLKKNGSMRVNLYRRLNLL